MISHWRNYDTHRTIIIEHKPGPPHDPMRYARDQIRLHLAAAGLKMDDDIYAVYEYGDWILEDKAP